MLQSSSIAILEVDWFSGIFNKSLGRERVAIIPRRGILKGLTGLSGAVVLGPTEMVLVPSSSDAILLSPSSSI